MYIRQVKRCEKKNMKHFVRTAARTKIISENWRGGSDGQKQQVEIIKCEQSIILDW